MRISVSVAGALAAAGVLLGAAQAQASVVFSDDFNDNDVSDWILASNYSGPSGIDAGGVLGPYIDAPPGSPAPIHAEASQVLNLVPGDYSLTFDAYVPSCSGCTISYFVALDTAVKYLHASNGVWDIGQTVDFGPLAGGPHLLSLGMYTTLAISGHFVAKFDNVVLDAERLAPTAVPEPATWTMMLVGAGLMGASLRRRAAAA
jgi:hypothetical protein